MQQTLIICDGPWGLFFISCYMIGLELSNIGHVLGFYKMMEAGGGLFGHWSLVIGEVAVGGLFSHWSLGK